MEALDAHVIPSPEQPMAVARTFVLERFVEPPGDADGRLTLRHWRGGWWSWRRTHWIEAAAHDLRAGAYAWTEDAVCEETMLEGPKGGLKKDKKIEAALKQLGIGHEKALQIMMPWNPTRNRIADLIEALAAVCNTDAEEMPSWMYPVIPPGTPPADEIVSCANGLLHVPTHRLWPHSALYLNQISVPFGYQVDAPSPERWLCFLSELWPDDPDSIALLRQWFGYVISGDIRQHAILLLIGPPRSGKGTIARLLKEMVGRGNHCGPTLASLGTNFGLAPLIGKPLAIISDARLGGADVGVVVERLLSLSGEDALTIDRKYQTAWTGTLSTRLVVISNELPRLGDASGAIATRFKTLVLTQSWLGREDRDLTRSLIEELPGILNWALEGLEQLSAQGRFTEPQSSVDAMVELQDLVSPVGAFLRDRCERGPYEESVAAVWEAWKAWALDNGHHNGTKQSLGRNLRAAVPGVRVAQPRDAQGKQSQRVYHGFRLLTATLHLPNGNTVPQQQNLGENRVSQRVSGSDAEPDTHRHALFAEVSPVGNRVEEMRLRLEQNGHYPTTCPDCGGNLAGMGSPPYCATCDKEVTA